MLFESESNGLMKRCYLSRKQRRGYMLQIVVQLSSKHGRDEIPKKWPDICLE
jgi:hypothetical protein